MFPVLVLFVPSKLLSATTRRLWETPWSGRLWPWNSRCTRHSIADLIQLNRGPLNTLAFLDGEVRSPTYHKHTLVVLSPFNFARTLGQYLSLSLSLFFASLSHEFFRLVRLVRSVSVHVVAIRIKIECNHGAHAGLLLRRSPRREAFSARLDDRQTRNSAAFIRYYGNDGILSGELSLPFAKTCQLTVDPLFARWADDASSRTGCCLMARKW